MSTRPNRPTFLCSILVSLNCVIYWSNCNAVNQEPIAYVGNSTPHHHERFFTAEKLHRPIKNMFGGSRSGIRPLTAEFKCYDYQLQWRSFMLPKCALLLLFWVVAWSSLLNTHVYKGVPKPLPTHETFLKIPPKSL